MPTVHVRLLWANGDASIVVADHQVTEIQYQGPKGMTSFRITGESEPDGLDTYSEQGRSWTRVHKNGRIGSVLMTPMGTFAAWAAPNGAFKSAGAYGSVPKAKAVADEEAACQHCTCEPWR